MAEPVLREGEVLAGKYRIDRVLGQGGMGLVLGAFHLELEQPVAVKVLHREVAERGDAAARFRREARAAAKIKSEHVVRVLDVGTLEGGGAYMVMEYLEGNDLAEEMLRRGQLPIPETLDLMLQACEAVSEAHRAGIIHRDLKPANLFLSHRPDGSRVTKVLDFGISKSVVPGSTSDPSLTSTSTIMGSPLYMSPEQMRSARDVDARTDVWSIGTILFEAIAGNPPFAGESVPQICAALLHDPPPPMQTFRPDVPPALEQIIVRCLAKNREERWSSVGELANALAPFAPNESRLYANRANRSKTTEDAPSPAANAAKSGVDRPSPQAITLDPRVATPAPASPTLQSSPSSPHSAATVNSWGTTGSRKRPARIVWMALGGAVIAGAALWATGSLRRSTSVAVPITVLSATNTVTASPPPPLETAPVAPPAAASTPSSSPVAEAVGRPSASAVVVAHAAPAKSATSKHDIANRPPPAKVETISDFGGRR